VKTNSVHVRQSEKGQGHYTASSLKKQVRDNDKCD